MSVDGNRREETGWSGSGGGSSLFETAPAFQAGWQSDAGRSVPDVSYNGDASTGVPVYISNSDFTESGWIQLGGTSAGAPQWAGLIALANSARLSPLSTTGNAVYGAANEGYAPAYIDIIFGSNGGFFAGTRYDYVTGLGSPRAEWLVPALSGF